MEVRCRIGGEGLVLLFGLLRVYVSLRFELCGKRSRIYGSISRV